MSTTILLIGCAYSVLACSASKPSNHDEESRKMVVDGRTSGPVSSGEPPCEAENCRMGAELQLEDLANPGTNPITFGGAECTSYTSVTDTGSHTGPSCQCAVESDDGFIYVGPKGVGCFRFGRAGNCLWDEDEFDGCDLDDAHSCDDVCDDLAKRITDDQARVFTDAEVLSTACEPLFSYDGPECLTVFQINGRCYVNYSYQDGQSYDCALGRKQILKRYAEDAD
jgi:hypothetical protein